MFSALDAGNQLDRGLEELLQMRQFSLPNNREPVLALRG